MAADTAYVPGVCNINHAEIAHRRKAGYLGLGLFIVGLAVLLVTGAPVWLRLLLVLPAILAASGFLQAKNKFCVGYGAAGLQNADGNDLTGKTIDDDAAKTKDRQRARIINLQSLAYGMAAALITLFV